MDLNDGDGGGGGDDAGGASSADLMGGGGGDQQQQSGDQGSGGDGGQSGAGDQGSGDQGGADPEWYGSLSGDVEGETAAHRDWVKSKGFKDLDSLVKSYRSTEQALHGKGGPTVPGEGASEDQVKAFRSAIGVPEDAAGYERPAPTDADGKPLELNTAMLDRVTANGVKFGAPKAALDAILKEEMQAQLDDDAATIKEFDDRAAAHVKAWGAEKDAKMAAVDRAFGALGVNRKEALALRAAWGPEKAFDTMARIGLGLGEDKMMDGGGARRFGASAKEAQAEMNTLKSDQAFMEKARIPGSAEKQRWDRLQATVGAEADRAAAAGG